MHITLFITTLMIAFLFLVIRNKLSIRWVKHSFAIYSVIFTITAIAIGTVYIAENKTKLKAVASEIIHSNEPQRYEAPEAMISQHSVKGAVKLTAPSIEQLPELPRGCEVTSLGMLLEYNDISIDKMELAKRVKKDQTPYHVSEEEIHFGNPYNGFVGDMYSFDTPGLGVYHGPIAALAAEYAGDRVHDFTGSNFAAIISQLNQSRPVWVIINATYQELPDEQFTTWQTSDGPVKITMREHSVLVTGYDHEYIYFNDPLNKKEKAPIEAFKAAWIQMGKQAITVF